MTVNYKFKTTPYEHQRTALSKAGHKSSYGFLMEMGTGKSKCLIDNMAQMYLDGLINFALIIAPKGVYRNWISKEIPEHLPDEIPHRVIRWANDPNKAQQAELRSVYESFNGLTIVVMNVEAFSTVKGQKAGVWFASKRGANGLIAIDESTTIKNPSARRTKALTRIAAGFAYRRILTGSPVTKSPLDVYSQFEFLGPGLLGFESFYAFQARYSVMQRRKMGAANFNQVVGYRNLDELTDRIDRYAYRVLKKDCLDLPEKIYTARYVTMTDEQFKMYEQIRKTAVLMLDNGELVTTQHVITQLLRLQQILSGHLKTDDGEIVTFKSSRMDALTEVLEEHDGSAIIWSRFRHDIQQITETLKKKYGEDSVAAYYGDTSSDERNRIVHDFQDPNHPLKYFVGNPSTGGYGLTLTAANLMIFYANSFDLEHRLQAQDRMHRIGQRNACTYVDLITEGTIDEKIVAALQSKMQLGALVLGEEAQEWLRIQPKKP
jgi:SNF2 family DNA or RNA helicase